MEGRKDRGKYGAQKGRLDPHASTTNKEKKRHKNPGMIKYRPANMHKKFMSMKATQVSNAQRVDGKQLCAQIRSHKSHVRDKKGR